MIYNRCLLSLWLVLASGNILAAESAADNVADSTGKATTSTNVENYSFAYSSEHSVNAYKSKLALFPAFDVSSSKQLAMYDRSSRKVLAVGISQALEAKKQKVGVFKRSATTQWQEQYLPQPELSKLANLYTFPTRGVRVPVYYEGTKKVLNRVVAQTKAGQLYFTAKFGDKADPNIHFPSQKLTYKLTNLRGNMSENGSLTYKKSNPFDAAKHGYVINVALNKNVSSRFTVAPSLRINGTLEVDVSTSKGKKGKSGYDGDNGYSYSNSAFGSALGALGGGNGSDGRDGGNGQRGNNGSDGRSAKDVGRVSVSIKPQSSRFYEEQLKDFQYSSNQGSNHLLLEQNQSIKIAATGGSGGDGGNGGSGGDGGDGGAGSAGYKGSNATAYSNGGRGGRGGNGGDGGNGGRGGNAGDGGDGGNGGIITAKLYGPSLFKLNSRKSLVASLSGGSRGSAGSKGSGGSAGSAGYAGSGGPGGNAYYNTSCYTDAYGKARCKTVTKNAGSSGSSGRSGSRGRSGSSGSSGSRGDSGSSGSLRFQSL